MMKLIYIALLCVDIKRYAKHNNFVDDKIAFGWVYVFYNLIYYKLKVKVINIWNAAAILKR